jgi:hypothetical protein
MWPDLGRALINQSIEVGRQRLVNVRFEAHYGLKSIITPNPRKVPHADIKRSAPPKEERMNFTATPDFEIPSGNRLSR